MIRVYGYLGHISPELRDDAVSADLVVGGRRHLDALDVPQDKRVVLGLIGPAIEAIKLLDDDAKAVVVASGDPLYFGVVRRLRQAGLDCEVIPEVTSIQAAFAALALPWDDAQIVNAHSRGIETAVRICRSHPKVAVLTAPGKGIHELAAALADTTKVFVAAEHLGEPNQRVRSFSASQVLALGEDEIESPYVVIVLDHDPSDPEALGVNPEIAGDANMNPEGEPAPGSDTAPDGSDREPIIGQVYKSSRARANAQRIDDALGITTKRYDGPSATGLVAAWSECDLIISHLALGATTRLIAPLLADKKTDPGVVVVDEAGNFAIPLVGGHIGGANELSRRIGEALGGTAVVSTATDSLGIPALDQLGWAFTGDVAGVTGALIEGQPVQLVKDHMWPLPPLPENLSEQAENPAARVIVTDQTKPVPDDLPSVVLNPNSLVVGMGCNKDTSLDSLRELLTATLDEAGLSISSVTALTSADVKVGEKGLIQLAAELGVVYRTFDTETLDAQQVPNPSQTVKDEVGTSSVAEASVLAYGSELIVPKHKSSEATCAVGRIPARGTLHVVGLGPGSRDLLTPRAKQVISNANMVVGYGPYVRQIRDLVSPYAEIMATKMGTEEQRTQAAIEAARSGLDVAFVCGGDPAIYAMASPTLEMGTDGIDVDIVPGVTAELAISAILGAPLGHDHATISLSDLHTDWDLILQRVRAAAEGDFVITFYNPRSRTRTHHLPDALSIISEYRSPDTPVACVAQAERAQQKVRMSTLGEFKPEWVDMNTMVVVGSHTTRFVTTGNGDKLIVTPRDYHWMDGHVTGEQKLNYHHAERPKMSRAEYRGEAKND